MKEQHFSLIKEKFIVQIKHERLKRAIEIEEELKRKADACERKLEESSSEWKKTRKKRDGRSVRMSKKL